MNNYDGLGKALLFFGLVLVMVGTIFLLLPRIPWIGKLPGDIFYRGEKASFYFPITTCILISIILSLLFFLFKR
jgi:hypothetical protein